MVAPCQGPRSNHGHYCRICDCDRCVLGASESMEVDQKTLLWRGNSNTTSTNLLYPGSDDLFREIACLDPLALAYSDQTTMITSRKERSTR